jgi:preprotein translocase subunit SecA
MNTRRIRHVTDHLSLSERLHYALQRARGIPIQTDLSRYDEKVGSILAIDLGSLTDSQIARRATELRAGRYDAGRSIHDHELIEWFALSSECAQRVLGERPYPVQLAAGLVLAEGKLVQMKTGEGKTLAAVPAALVGSLTGESVHIFTANDYLARRDAAWMGDIYRMLGCSVDYVNDDTSTDRKRAAYAADVTYMTARRAGFDFLTDQMAHHPANLVQRSPGLAIVDEADYILIDESRIPLVIARERPGPQIDPVEIDRFVRALRPGEHFTSDRAGRICVLTISGQQAVQAAFGCPGMETDEGFPYYAAANVALHAHHLLTRDVDYIVRENRIELVDEFTGRVAENRKWPYGIQTALEAKEGVPLLPSGEVCGSITTHHFIARYPRIAAMTATAEPSARELMETYGLKTVIIPPNRPNLLKRDPDRVFTTREAKLGALVTRISQLHAAGRPVLVGTISVAESEKLATRLRTSGINCSVLNARNDEEEATIIAEAGRPGAVTISTNMAGRGTDIRLGGADESRAVEVVRLGGLYVIGTNRHESSRVDEQLAGRAGRQGDPGGTCTMVSLQDDLVTHYAITDLLPQQYRESNDDSEIRDPAVAREITRGQSIVEEQHHSMRRTLRRYSEIVERQRKVIEQLRTDALVHNDVPEELLERVEPAIPDDADVTGSKDDRGEGEGRILARCLVAALDDAWAEYLEWTGVLREGIHLRRYAGRDPYLEFIAAADAEFDEVVESALHAAADHFTAWREKQPPGRHRDGSRTDQEDLEPASTWTYLINDDPFPHFSVLSVGSSNFAAAFVSMILSPVVAVVRLVDRLRSRTKGGPE